MLWPNGTVKQRDCYIKRISDKAYKLVGVCLNCRACSGSLLSYTCAVRGHRGSTSFTIVTDA